MQSPATAAPTALARALLEATGTVRLQAGRGGSPGATPQAFGVPPPPQVCGEAQVPHEATVRGAPQLSVPVTAPQVLASRPQKAASVSGMQAMAVETEP